MEVDNVDASAARRCPAEAADTVTLTWYENTRASRARPVATAVVKVATLFNHPDDGTPWSVNVTLSGASSSVNATLEASRALGTPMDVATEEAMAFASLDCAAAATAVAAALADEQVSKMHAVMLPTTGTAGGGGLGG
jgi:hypothetical protein